MKGRRFAVALLLVVFSAAMAWAVPPGKTLEWETKAGKVIFDGKLHADKGMKCNDCHTRIFKMKKGGAAMTMAVLNEGKYCGECHNGTKAFKTSEQSGCKRCHRQ